MRPARLLALAALVAALAGCQKEPPPTPSPSPDGVETIRGNERLGWDQQAFDTAELGTFRFAVYVDGGRSELSDVSCGATAGANGFACSGRLPAMTPGQHSLELAAFTLDGGTTVESPRSPPLRVNVTAIVGAQAGTLRAGRAGTTSDGVPLRLDVVVEGLDGPSDLAFAGDGRLFIAERGGLVRIVDLRGAQQWASRVARSGDELDAEVIALALDREFERTGHVFAVQVAGAGFSILRYREVNGILGERMVLLHGVPARAERTAAAIGIGPDSKLYVALDDGGDPRAANAAGSLNGTLLRLNRDGTTPDDARLVGTPTVSSGYRSPRALDWGPGGVLWIADGAPRVPERLAAVVLSDARERRPVPAVSYALAAETHPSDAIVYRGEMFPTFQGNVIVAAEAGHLLRIVFDRRAPTRAVASERLLDGVEPIRAIAVDPTGAIYFATPRSIVRLSRDP
jgi:glucose/arabinose dehydrogenase